MENNNNNNESKRPEDSAFKQQRLKAWQPLLTPLWVISTFGVIGVLFLIIGIVVLMASRNVVEYEIRYDNIISTCQFNCSSTNDCANCTSTVTFDIQRDMEKPIFFYYKLTNFYQNHRRYVKSRDDAQLSGESPSRPSACDPLAHFHEQTLYPCGLIANSFFNDTFTACYNEQSNGSCIPMTANDSTWVKEGIAWKSDKDKKFKYRPMVEGEVNVGPGQFPLPRVDDEDFIVWMRTAGLPTFKKLHRKIERSFKKGDKIVVTFKNNFPVGQFSGEKAMVLSTTSWLGGKNDFLGWAYIVVAIICIVLAVLFGVKHKFAPRAMGDTNYLNWSGNASKVSNGSKN